MRAWLTLSVLLLTPTTSWAEWQFKPFVGTTLAGTSTYVGAEEAAGERHYLLGGSATWLGNIVGVEADVSRVPSLFVSKRNPDILGGGVTTLTGSVVLALPRKITQYSLRPYVTGGGGWMRARIDQRFALFNVDRTRPVMVIGGGATGFVNDRIGLNWDLRYFRGLGGAEDTGLTIGKEETSFWRATMGVAIRVGSAR